jgi:hypothetical protein
VATQQTGNGIVVTTAVELIGVGLLALLASANDQLGQIIVIFMVGILLLWLISHTSQLQSFPFLGGKT